MSRYDGIFKYKDENGNVYELFPNVKTDTSLSASGKAADAATVGERFRTIESIAKGAGKGMSYMTYGEMIDAVNAMDNTALNVGQSIYIGTVDVPDLWIYSIEDTAVDYAFVDDDSLVAKLKVDGTIQVGYFKLAQLETQKVDLTRLDTLESNFSTAANDIGGSLVALGVEVPEGTSLGEMSTIIDTLNKGEFNGTITTLDGSIVLTAGYYTGGTITLNLAGQTYTATIGGGSATTCAENGSATIPFGSISSQTASLLTVSGGLIKALSSIPSSSLQFTITNLRANGGNGNGATSTIKVYHNDTLINTSTVNMPTYGKTGTNTIDVNVPAMSADDTIKVIATHATGYIDGSITFTITSATHTWIF